MTTVLTHQDTAALLVSLQSANQRVSHEYPDAPAPRQPVHTVYGGAHLFKADTPVRLGRIALQALHDYAPDSATFARCLAIPAAIADTVYSRVRDKLTQQAVEDFRIDFEDGYGPRPDAEEDNHAVAAAGHVAQGLRDRTLSPNIGIRIKPLDEALCERGLRTLDLFMTTLTTITGKHLPPNLIVTLPKVSAAAQVAALHSALTTLEQNLGLPSHYVKIELMVETTQAIIDGSGCCPLRTWVQAAGGRCTGAHLGAYDYTAVCNIIATHQRMLHPACDFARHMMQVALAGSNVMLSDGATNTIPVGPHRAAPDITLNAAQHQANQQVVHDAWREHSQHIRHALEGGYYQGWDLHPAQLPVRYAAVYAFFLEALEPVAQRLQRFLELAARATLSGATFDDAATGQGLLNFFLRGKACGALRDSEVARSGLTPLELQTRSFAQILAVRTPEADA